jgi:hypothetical protein
MKSRVVNDRGYFHYKNQHFFVGNPFSGYNIGIKERAGKHCEVWFDNYKLGVINPVTLQIETEVVEEDYMIMCYLCSQTFSLPMRSDHTD